MSPRKPRTISDDIRDALAHVPADEPHVEIEELALPKSTTPDIAALSFDEKVALRDELNASIEADRNAEVEKFKAETAERARKLGLPDPYSDQPKSARKSRGEGSAKAPAVSQVPPAGAQIVHGPDGKTWWPGKKGKRPSWAA